MENAKQIALRALTGAFIERDPNVVERYFAEDYVQHNPRFLTDGQLFPAS